MAYTCAIKHCSNGAYRLNKWKQQLCTTCGCLHKEKECDCTPPFRLFPFPTRKKNSERRERWKQLVGRKDGNKLWSPSKDSRVCSSHFEDEQPTVKNPLLTQHLGYDGAQKRVKRIQFFNNENEPPAKYVIRERQQTKYFPDPPVEEAVKPTHVYLSSVLFIYMFIKFLTDHIMSLHSKIKTLQAENRELKKEVLKLRRKHAFVESLLACDKDVKFFTGLPSKSIFNLLHGYISPLVNRRWLGTRTVKQARNFINDPQRFGPTRKLTSKAEFLLTLMRMRLGLTGRDLAKRFQISETLCGRIFLTWLRACSQVFGSMVYVPDIETLHSTRPAKFSHFSNLHSIIDCTEIFIETPKNLELQTLTWSDYKHHNTLKLLVACSMNSSIVYVSPAYTGRMSDKALTLDCGYLDKVPMHQSIMVDKGFNIADECAERCITLHIPPGRRGQSQMTSAAVKKTKRIANTRILIEQVIRRLKTFRILAQELPISLIPHVDEIVAVCSGICNTSVPITK